MTVEQLKNAFDRFLKEHKIYEAWYERYRLDNLAYNDEIPIEEFLQGILNEGEEQIHNIFYSGIQATLFQIDNKFIKENKKCDILSTMEMAEFDQLWCKNYKDYIKEFEN